MITRTFPGRFSSLEAISDLVVEQAQTAGFDEQECYGIQLAVDEAATNIIEHGYGGEGKGEITCQCERTPTEIRIILQDQAPPFEITDIPDPDPQASLEELKPRGLGLFFIHKMMDEVKYHNDPRNGNTLILVKRKKH